MKKNKIIFWVSSILVAFIMLFSGIGYFTDAEMQVAFAQLGFPNYFRVELGIAKILGAIGLLLPMVPYRMKLFVFFGLGVTLFSAAIAHMASGDPISMTLLPVVMLGLLMVSYVYYHRINAKKLA